MSWWTWFGSGLVLLAIEVLTPGTLVWSFFAVGAIAAAAAVAAAPTMSLFAQSLVFVGVSVASLAVFRKPLLKWLEDRSPKAKAVDSLIGEIAVTLADIPAGAVGKVELRGTTWSVKNAGHETIPVSTRCRVEKVDGLMLWIRGEA